MFNQATEIAPEENSIDFIDATSGGSLPKGWFNINGEKSLVKGCSYFGTEALSEVLAYNLAESLCLKHIVYKLMPARFFRELEVKNDKCKFVSICPFYGKVRLIKVSLFNLIALPYISSGISNVSITKKECLDYTLTLGKGVRDKIFDIILFDALICNVDRHPGNIDLFIDSKTNRVADVFYIHNYGTSLYHDADEIGYSKDKSDLFFDTHQEQVTYMLNYGFRPSQQFNFDGAYERWLKLSSGIFYCHPNLSTVSKIKDMVKERLEFYGNFL